MIPSLSILHFLHKIFMGENNAYSKIYSPPDTAHIMFCTVFSSTSWKVAGLIPDGVIGIFH